MPAVADEAEDLRNRRILSRQRLHRAQPFGKHAGAMEQLLIERAHRGKPLAREFAALHADNIEAFEACVLAVHEAERNHVAANPADAANHHLRPNPRELVHRGQPAYENKIADLAVTAKRGRGREDHIDTNLAIVADMAAIHKIAAVADTSDAATGDGPGVHGDRFPDGAALPDLEPGKFAAITQGLRRRAQRDEGVDRAAGADGGLRRDVDMPDQFAVCADHGVAADDAIGTNRCTLADHSAILNPRGGIDRTHRRVSYRWW